MIKYIKVKKAEIELKYRFYSLILAFTKDKESIVKGVLNLMAELGSAPVEQIKERFYEQLTKLIYEEVKKSNDN